MRCDEIFFIFSEPKGRDLFLATSSDSILFLEPLYRTSETYDFQFQIAIFFMRCDEIFFVISEP